MKWQVRVKEFLHFFSGAASAKPQGDFKRTHVIKLSHYADKGGICSSVEVYAQHALRNGLVEGAQHKATRMQLEALQKRAA